MDRSLLEKKALAELREIASTLELTGYTRLRKADLVDLIIGTDGAAIASTNGSTPKNDNDTDHGTGNGANGSVEHADGQDSSADDGDATDATDTRADDSRADDSDQADEADDGDADTRTGPHRAVDHREAARARSRSRRERSRSGGSSDDDARPSDRSDDDQSDDDQSDDDWSNDDDPSNRDKDDDISKGGNNNGGGNNSGGGGRRRKNRRRGKNRGSSGGGGNKGQGQNSNQGQNQGGNNEDLSDAEVREGVLDLLPEGYGFLRTTGYLTGDHDVYVSQSYVRRFNLRRGDKVKGPIRANNRGNDKFPALARVDEIEGLSVDEHKQLTRTQFKDLTPLFPNERLRLETEEKAPISMRIMDMMSPIGKGQRGLIVSPPKAGKTTILKQLAAAIEANNPEAHLMVVLVDERPEEVTDFERSCKGEVISSTFDRPADDHTQVAELAIERAQRLVERGMDVVILLDSITRLGRAYNLAAPASGRILSGGIDSAALYPPKRFFGAARNIEDGGSLTILASALIETGSKMDEVIFEEFKGTGNMELRLDRRMEQKRIFPAIDVQASGTRREELLLGKSELEVIWKLRRVLAQMDTGAALELLIDKLKATRSNKQFLQAIANSNIG
ncbi:transcription termination factor Rho [Salsipaludibacter albus]|uniref:transcription termination factor Rho n=1 Tax=Salsipaludibacter albus TaxID=2849650 RepID=UPI001EE4AE0C|nr:transcription termination factor Rho [Salsipaludibacter albus]MBY5163820.1 transcription termination factor Rho [Salsipaludibacter albus]